MADNRNPCRAGASSSFGESVIIDTAHVFDSCRDRDCFEDVAVFLTPEGQELIEHTSNVRVACANILWSNITVEPVQFNRGFYEITVRYYIKLECEACVCLGRPTPFVGIATVEKSVVLYGSEGNVKIFKSNPCNSGFCSRPNLCEPSSNLPTAVVETVEPIVLNVRVAEPGCCTSCFRCCNSDEIPNIGDDTTELNFREDRAHLLVSLGCFSVISIERPEQYRVNATAYSVPDKECFSNDSDTSPCELFRNMEFPISEFQPSTLNSNTNDRDSGCGCGCKG